MKLDQLLKWSGLTSTGGESKHIIQSGLVRVNGMTETRRGRALRSGDIVSVEGAGEFEVVVEKS
ncbi:MAG: RNA-binding S4 domain-containing protein [Firmicutes bacterium]|nr:RNA-binding S4 domain-containing protein [Bacillota bacterium]